MTNRQTEFTEEQKLIISENRGKHVKDVKDDLNRLWASFERADGSVVQVEHTILGDWAVQTTSPSGGIYWEVDTFTTFDDAWMVAKALTLTKSAKFQCI